MTRQVDDVMCRLVVRTSVTWWYLLSSSYVVLLSPAYILATAPVYDPTELSRANRVATVQRSLSRLHHTPSDSLNVADAYAPWCHLVFRHASVMTAVVIG